MKQITSFFLALVFIVSLAACGAKPTNELYTEPKTEGITEASAPQETTTHETAAEEPEEDEDESIITFDTDELHVKLDTSTGHMDVTGSFWMGVDAFSEFCKGKDIRSITTEAVWEKSFENLKTVKTVTIQNCDYIEADAFRGCSALESVELPDTVEDICTGAFAGCSSLRSISLPKQLQYLASDAFDGVPAFSGNKYWKNGAFIVDKKLYTVDPKAIGTAYTVPDGVTETMYYAFDACDQLQELTFSDSVVKVTSIGLPKNLRKMQFGKQLKEFDLWCNYRRGMEGIAVWSSLVEINVDKANATYSSENGVLYNKDKTELIYYPPNSKQIDYAVPDTVKSLKEDALSNTKIRKLRIGKGLTDIDFGIAHSENGGALPQTLESVSVHLQNPVYTVDMYGVVFNKDKTVLYYYPPAQKRSSYTVPNSVQEIDDMAFLDADEVGNLKELHVGKNVQKLGHMDYYNLELYYAGTEEELMKLEMCCLPEPEHIHYGKR